MSTKEPSTLPTSVRDIQSESRDSGLVPLDARLSRLLTHRARAAGRGTFFFPASTLLKLLLSRPSALDAGGVIELPLDAVAGPQPRVLVADELEALLESLDTAARSA